MALITTIRIALAVSFFGLLSFLLGVVAENKKPPFGTPIRVKDIVVCHFPGDPTVALGSLSVIALVVAGVLGHVSVFYPYDGKNVPKGALFRSTALVVFFIIAEFCTALALVLMLWATISEGLLRSQNVYHDTNAQCATAKTGLFGGAAFVALDAALFWLLCQMLTSNARADYADDEDNNKGDYGQVYASDYSANVGEARVL